MDETTKELLEFLQSSNEDRLLEKVISWPEGEVIPLHQLLLQLMEEKGLSKNQVVEQSCLNRIYTYQILQGKKRPGRDKLLAICLAMKLDYSECQRVLQVGGHGVLYARTRRDAVIIYALKKRLSVVDTNTVLYECGEPTLE